MLLLSYISIVIKYMYIDTAMNYWNFISEASCNVEGKTVVMICKLSLGLKNEIIGLGTIVELLISWQCLQVGYRLHDNNLVWFFCCIKHVSQCLSELNEFVGQLRARRSFATEPATITVFAAQTIMFIFAWLLFYFIITSTWAVIHVEIVRAMLNITLWLVIRN